MIAWSIAVIEFSVLTMFGILGKCRDITVLFMCHDDRMCRNVQSVLVPLVLKVCRLVDDIGLFGFLNGLSFEACSVSFRCGEACWGRLNRPGLS